MALRITHHERVPGHSNRWHVYLHGHERPLPVELPDEERSKLDLSDDEIHDLIPTAVERTHIDVPDLPAQEGSHEVSWETPVRVLQTHFMA
jgi:hypothetical protein